MPKLLTESDIALAIGRNVEVVRRLRRQGFGPEPTMWARKGPTAMPLYEPSAEAEWADAFKRLGIRPRKRRKSSTTITEAHTA